MCLLDLTKLSPGTHSICSYLDKTLHQGQANQYSRMEWEGAHESSHLTEAHEQLMLSRGEIVSAL